jgi:hypothetical protein
MWTLVFMHLLVGVTSTVPGFKSQDECLRVAVAHREQLRSLNIHDMDVACIKDD